MDGRLMLWGIVIVFIPVAAAVVAVVAIRRRRAARVPTREEILRNARRAGQQMTKQSRTARRGGRRYPNSDSQGNLSLGSAADSGSGGGE